MQVGFGKKLLGICYGSWLKEWDERDRKRPLCKLGSLAMGTEISEVFCCYNSFDLLCAICSLTFASKIDLSCVLICTVHCVSTYKCPPSTWGHFPAYPSSCAIHEVVSYLHLPPSLPHLASRGCSIPGIFKNKAATQWTGCIMVEDESKQYTRFA